MLCGELLRLCQRVTCCLEGEAQVTSQAQGNGGSTCLHHVVCDGWGWCTSRV